MRERDESLKDEMKERNKKKGSEFIRFFYDIVGF